MLCARRRARTLFLEKARMQSSGVGCAGVSVDVALVPPLADDWPPDVLGIVSSGMWHEKAISSSAFSLEHVHV